MPKKREPFEVEFDKGYEILQKNLQAARRYANDLARKPGMQAAAEEYKEQAAAAFDQGLDALQRERAAAIRAREMAARNAEKHRHAGSKGGGKGKRGKGRHGK